MTGYTTNSLNQYTSVGSTTYNYDDNGNLTNDGFYKYYYDSENRLTDVNYVVNDNPVASYSYDYLGRRVSKTIHDSQTTIHYCYDGDQVIAEYGGQGALLRKFVYGPAIDEPVAMYVNGEGWYYYHYDGLGSVVALSDSTGEITEQCSYDVFGEPSCISGVGNPYKFTGRRYDAETGLYYYRNRYYNPEIGRFTSADPIGYYYSMNLYEYCWNDPINWLDPYGLWSEEDHRRLGRYGGGGPDDPFDYSRLDRDFRPHNPLYTHRHFRDRTDVRKDLLDAARRGDARAFEEHMHEMQDTYSHGEGISGVLNHIWHGHSPDDASLHQDAYDKARWETELWEKIWDKYNSPKKK